MDTRLEISTLGGVRILRGGELVTGLSTRKAEALLIYLASTHRPQPREVLADLLWDERTQSQALSNLRGLLSNLHQTLGECILISRDQVQINPEEPLWLDAFELEGCLQAVRQQGGWNAETASQVTEALQLYRGDFLAGFSVYDCRGFEDWVVRERERLHRLAVEGYSNLVAYALEQKDYPTGIAQATRLLELDPLLESAHRQMMRLFAESGQRGAALGQYATCRKLLRTELGVDPEPETHALYEQIRVGKLVDKGGSISLPVGTVTFLFTDIEGSTHLWTQFPRSMPTTLERHHTLLRQAIESHHGYVFQIVGDVFCAAFSSAFDGLQAAISAQQALQAEPWRETGPLKVRMALHTGTAELRAGEYTCGEYLSGLTLSLVSRLLSAGHGGQVLLSQVSRDLFTYDLPEGAGFLDLGEHRLKGLSQPERIYQLLYPGLLSNFPPLNSLSAYPNNLPLQLTSFIGREQENEVIKQLLSSSRLVTLTGSGGVGKTRLALEVGEDLLPEYPDGAWLVELAPVSDPQYILPAIASVFNLQEQASRPLLQVVTDFLRQKKLLLLLDNCEHLIATCAQLTETLLKNACELHILASSREALGIGAETAYSVPSLSLPEPHPDFVAGQLEQSEAVRLFVDRAGRILPGFAINPANAAAITQICLRLDGIPLALELAAARVKLLRVEQIAERLDDAFRLLTGGSRTALPRQQTLRATIDWSYQLLSESERILLRRLAVFAGGWDLEAAEQICCDGEKQGIGERGEGLDSSPLPFPISPKVNLEPVPHLPSYDILDLLSGLVSKSMIGVDREQGKEARYRLLETIRQYAREKLLDSGKMEELRKRHLEYFVKWAQVAEQKLHGAEQASWYRQLESNMDNIRLALEWGLESDPIASLCLTTALDLFWYGTNHLVEGVHWLETCLQKPENTARTALRGRALVSYAHLSYWTSGHPDMGKWAQEGLEICQENEDRFGQARAHHLLGFLSSWYSDLPTARAHDEAALELFRAIGDRWWEARTLRGLSDLSIERDEIPAAKKYLEQSLQIDQELKDERGFALDLLRQAPIFGQYEGNLSRGRELYEQSLAITEKLQLSNIVSEIRGYLAYLLLWQGDFAAASENIEKGIDNYTRDGNTYLALVYRYCSGRLLVCQGYYPQAVELLEQTIAQLDALTYQGLRTYQKSILSTLAYALINLNELRRAKTVLNQLRNQPGGFYWFFDQLMVPRAFGLMAFLEGDGPKAARKYRECLELAWKRSYKTGAILALEGYAGAFHLLGIHLKAIQSLAAAYAFRKKIGAPIWPGDQPFHDRLLSGLKSQLGETAFSEAWADGEKLPFDQAVELVRSLPIDAKLPG